MICEQLVRGIILCNKNKVNSVIIKRYITREVCQVLLAVTAVLVLALLCQQVVRYLNYVAVGKIATNILLILVSFEIPYLLAVLLPLCLSLAIVLAYGRLYADNEMAIMQMSGFNARRLMRLTVSIAGAVALFVLALMVWVNPWISMKRQQLMSSDGATIHLIQTLMPGRFQASPDGHHVMYVEEMSRDRERAEGVFLAQESQDPNHPDRSAWMLVFADQGYQMEDKETGDQFFVTADGYRYEGTPGENDYKITQFKKYAVRIPQADMHVVHPEVETLSTIDLLKDYHNPKWAAEFQWRFSLSIATFFLAMLAVALSPVGPRRSRYWALLPVVLFYVIYVNLLFVARHWVEQGSVPVTFGMWWVHGVMLIAILLTMLVKTSMSKVS